MREMKVLYIMVFALLMGCSTTEQTEITERWPDGTIKEEVTYLVNGETKEPIEIRTYSAGGVLFEVINHVTRDTLSFHDLNKPDAHYFPYTGVWQWEKTTRDSAGYITVKKPGRAISKETSLPAILHVDSTMMATRTIHFRNWSMHQHMKLFSYRDTLYSKISSIESRSNENTYDFTLSEDGSFLWIKFENNKADTVDVTFDDYFDIPLIYSLENDTLFISGVNEAYGKFEQVYTPFSDSSYLNRYLYSNARTSQGK
ncbi:MAG TPA: hypothetical protein VJ905_02625 [Halalkalibaculum sp.]|nr:hypothetical protein [Halalkalibaculum sp.]